MKRLLARLVRVSGAPTPGTGVAAAQAMLEDARSAHQRGQADQATALCASVLEADPANAEALNILGLLALQRGDAGRAQDLLAQSLSIHHDNAMGWVNRALAEQALGDLDGAELSLRTALRIEPCNAHAHNNLGIVLVTGGRGEEAHASFEQAVAHSPDNVEALNNLASSHKDRGELDSAAVLYSRAIEVRPEFASAHINLGAVLQQQGDPPAAEASFRRALALNPDSADAWNGLGTALFDARRYVDAEAAYREALARRPDLVESLCNLAELMHIRGRTEEARSTWERALALRPSDVEALNGLARLAIDRGDFAEADTRIRLALKHHPRHARSWINLAMAQKHSSLEDAEQSLREALQLEPGNAVARYNLAAILLVRDDYGNGFALYESRFDTFTQEFAGSRGLYEELRDGTWWRGGRLDGKHLLIWTEQGLGDAVMTMRYLPLLRSRGVSRVTVACSLPLACILGTVAGVDTVILIDRRPLPAFDVHCSLMSLPGLFETTHATVPASVPYLVVPADTAAVWEARVAGSDSRRIGICWAGNPLLKDDQRRSIYLSAFAPCFEVAGCDWISLQKDEPARATSAGTPIATEWIADCDDLMDTAALIDRLDLVITVDTVIAHLAGALGKPVWMLNRHRGDWRWGLTGMETPWYPTMEVVRQRPDEDWREVIERMNVQLKHFAGESA